MTVGQRQKRNLINELIQKRIEEKAFKVVKYNSLLPKIDQQIDPLVRQYFRESNAINDYYGGKKETPCEDCIKQSKCTLIEEMMKLVFEEATETMLDENKDIKTVDDNLTKGFEKLFININKLYDFYGFDFELSDPDEEDGDDAQDNQQGSKEENLS